jgi:preprotein translocase subunit YajC
MDQFFGFLFWIGVFIFFFIVALLCRKYRRAATAREKDIRAMKNSVKDSEVKSAGGLRI